MIDENVVGQAWLQVIEAAKTGLPEAEASSVIKTLGAAFKKIKARDEQGAIQTLFDAHGKAGAQEKQFYQAAFAPLDPKGQGQEEAPPPPPQETAPPAAPVSQGMASTSQPQPHSSSQTLVPRATTVAKQVLQAQLLREKYGTPR